MKTHELKIWPQFFDAVRNGTMRFQFRKDDRGYQVGDALKLDELRPGVGEYTGRSLNRTVTYVMRGEDAAKIGVPEGYCVLGIS